MRPSQSLGVIILVGQCLAASAASSFDLEDSAGRFWQAHIFGSDDRGRSSYPFVGQVFSYKVKGEFSGFLCSSNKFVTVAHGFTSGGKWTRTNSQSKPTPRELSDYLVRIEGCDRYYRVDDVAVGTTNSDLEYWKDYAVLTLNVDICLGAEIPAVGLPSDLRDLEVVDGRTSLDLNVDVAVVGYYRPTAVRDPTRRAELPHPQYEAKSAPRSLKDLGRSEQYTSIGRTFAISAHHGQLYFWHYVDATLGGSGGPLILDADGRPLVIGMHTSGGKQGNHSMASQGPFLAFMRKHCDDP